MLAVVGSGNIDWLLTGKALRIATHRIELPVEIILINGHDTGVPVVEV